MVCFCLSEMPDGVCPVQITHKQKLSIQWNLGEQAVEQLKQLAIQDECVHHLTHLCVCISLCLVSGILTTEEQKRAM